MPTTQSVRPTSGFSRHWLPRPAMAMVLSTLIAAVVCLPEANAGGKRKSRRKARPSSAQGASVETSKAAKSSNWSASDRRVGKASASKRRRGKRRAARPLDEAVLRYLPENCGAFATLDLAAILQSKCARDVLANRPTSMEEILGSLAPLGLELEHIERIALGTPSPVGSDISDYVAVLFCKQPPQMSSGFSPEGTPWSGERIGRATLWVRADKKDWAVCSIDDRVALAGHPDSIRAVLKRDAPVKLPEKLEHARRLTDPTATLAVSFLADGLVGAATMSMGVPGLAAGVEAINLEVEFDAELAVQWSLICRDDASAQQVNSMISGLWTLVQMQGIQNQEPAAQEILRSVSFHVEGPVVRANMKVPSSLVQFDAADAKPLAVAGCVPAVATAPATASNGAASAACPPTSYPSSPYGTPASAPGVLPGPPYANSYSVLPPNPTANVSGYAVPAGAVPAPYPVMNATGPRPAAPTLSPLKLTDVVRLVEAGVDEEVIIRHVKKHYLTAPLSADDLILLTESKATTKVITTLQETPSAPKSEQTEKPETKAPAAQPPTPQGAFDPYQSQSNPYQSESNPYQSESNPYQSNPYQQPKAGTPQPAPPASASPAATPAAPGK